MIPARVPWDVGANAFEHNQMTKTWDLCCGFVSNGLEQRCFTAPPTTICGEECFGFGIVESRNDGLRPEPGEQWQENPANFDDGEHCDDNFRNHRHEYAKDITFAEAK